MRRAFGRKARCGVRSAQALVVQYYIRCVRKNQIFRRHTDDTLFYYTIHERKFLLLKKSTVGPAFKKNIEIIFIIAFFIALRIVFSKLLAINVTNNFPLSLENTPILLAAVAYGPLVGAVVGGISALISCLLVGIFDQPVITESSSSTRSSVVSAALKKHSRTYFPKYLS